MIETLIQLGALIWAVGTIFGLMLALLGGIAIVVYTVVDVVRTDRRYR